MDRLDGGISGRKLLMPELLNTLVILGARSDRLSRVCCCPRGAARHRFSRYGHFNWSRQLAGGVGLAAMSPPTRRPASHRSVRPVELIGDSFPITTRSSNARCLARQEYHPPGTDLPSSPSKRQPVGSKMVRRRCAWRLMISHRSGVGISRSRRGSRVVIGTSPLQRSAASTISALEGLSELVGLLEAP
jgi:hypothetical protein